MCILNFTKIRWKITELLNSKVLAETPVYINVTFCQKTVTATDN
jgi:hypothetical protein